MKIVFTLFILCFFTSSLFAADFVVDSIANTPTALQCKELKDSGASKEDITAVNYS